MIIFRKVFFLCLMPFVAFANYWNLGDQVISSDVNHYRIIQKIGSGNCGNVFKVVDSAGEVFALKIYGESFKEDAKRAFDMKCELFHPNIIQPIDLVSLNNDQKGCVFEWVEGKELKNVRSLSFQEGLHICLQLIDVIQFALQKGFMYYDLHLGNLMIDKTNHLTIIDFDTFVPTSEILIKQCFIRYFDEVFTDQMLLIFNKMEMNREERIKFKTIIKNLAWNYNEDDLENKEIDCCFYYKKLNDFLTSYMNN